jgi:hypothetical protein
MKMGAVLESLRAPTFTVVNAQEGMDERRKRKPNNPKRITFFMILPPHMTCYVNFKIS